MPMQVCCTPIPPRLPETRLSALRVRLHTAFAVQRLTRGATVGAAVREAAAVDIDFQ